MSCLNPIFLKLGILPLYKYLVFCFTVKFKKINALPFFMVEYFTINYILTFLAGISIGFAIGVSIALAKEKSQRKLLNYLLDVYADKEEEKLPDPRKSGLDDEEKAKYLRAVLKSIEEEDKKIKKRKGKPKE